MKKIRLSSLIKHGVAVALLLALAPAARPIIDSAAHNASINKAIGVAAKGTPEEMVLAAIDAIREGRYKDAEATLDQLLTAEPNYRLAHLLRADLYAMRAMPLNSIGGGSKGPTDRLEDLRQEALVRIKRRTSPPPANALPANVLVFSSKQKYAVVVDTSVSRLFLFENQGGTPKLVRDHYVTIGKLGAQKVREGDQRTPLGVYFVTSHMPRSQLDKTYGAQADLYGVGAWPISYPNEWDKREGRTGHGIWLHGSPAQTYARAPQASNGCVVLTNPEMSQVAEHLQIGSTPVVITEKLEWLPQQEWQQRKEKALAKIESWRSAWEKLDTTTYLGHYGQQFRSEDGQDLASWQSQKTSVNSSKQWAKIQLEELSIFSSGGTAPMLVTSFGQDYKSNNLNNNMKKRLYWKQENGDWRIVWEGAANKGA
ncbi:L,D-transpeptidase Cds6 family protein [Formivibrio citricus]|uniref:L,D-transpeptidase Cds6 family protein n=1 Tax=Formivibrio citricus TaxID=83765 RepID=UPI0015A51D3D|nr:L,D-transpeptidase family protein [Formivibrio citricus]